MKILWIVLVVQTWNFYTASAQDKAALPLKCCNNEKNLLHDNKCVPDKSGKVSSVPLKCAEKYILDPNVFEDDGFNLTANGSLLIHDLESTIAPDE